MGHCDELYFDTMYDVPLSSFLQEPLKKKHTVEIDLEELFPFYDFDAASHEEIDGIKSFVIDAVSNLFHGKRSGFKGSVAPDKLSFGMSFFESPEIVVNLTGKEFL